MSYARSSRRTTRLTPNVTADTGSVPSPESGRDHQRAGAGVEAANGTSGRVGGHGDRRNGCPAAGQHRLPSGVMARAPDGSGSGTAIGVPALFVAAEIGVTANMLLAYAVLPSGVMAMPHVIPDPAGPP